MDTQVSTSSSRRLWLLSSFLGMLVLGSLVLVGVIFAQDQSLLQLDDLPEGFVAVEDRYVGNRAKDTDRGHPLTVDNLHDFADEDQQRLFAYENRQSFGALHPDIGLAMDFTYEYASERDAAWAAETLQAYWQSKGSTLTDFAPDSEPGVSALVGKTFVNHAEDDEVCHWFFGHQDSTLVIFWVHGFDAARVAETHHNTLRKLTE
jgi:hypothetical protein